MLQLYDSDTLLLSRTSEFTNFINVFSFEPQPAPCFTQSKHVSLVYRGGIHLKEFRDKRNPRAKDRVRLSGYSAEKVISEQKVEGIEKIIYTAEMQEEKVFQVGTPRQKL